MVGRSLGHYEIREPLGSGGMGDVYRAHDTSLNRDVAIKVLHEDVADDPDRLARLKREAHLLAALTHPNVATIHGFEESGGTRFLVMELVKGESLEQRLAAEGGGGFPVDEALGICRQIAEALEAAHDEGIIHRDLKPANVLITPDGRAKVLDFGLAKTVERQASDTDLSHSPTMTIAGTEAGVILGTAPYMSPEQVRGRPLDKRADIWAFGCVLYESLTGSRAFNRETVADTLAAILEVEPPWDGLPRDTPIAIRALLNRCLRKDPRRRLRDIGDARIEIEEVLEKPTESDEPGSVATVPVVRAARRRAALVFGVVGGVLGACAMAVALWFAGSLSYAPVPSEVPWHFAITLPDGKDDFWAPLAITADGSRVAFIAEGEDGREIFTQILGEPVATPVAGTSGFRIPNEFNSLFFSPDGNSLGFATTDAIWRVDLIDGGDPWRICDAPDFRGGSWGPDDTIVYAATPTSGLVRISASTVPCTPEHLTTGDPRHSTYQSHRFPHHLPGGRALLYTRRTVETGMWGGETVLLDLENGEEEVLLDGIGAVYVEPGYLLLGQGDYLAAAPFDSESLTLSGPATALRSRQELAFRNAQESQVRFAASTTGNLVYLKGRPPRTSTLALSEPGGEPQPLELSPPPPVESIVGNYLRLSPDGTQLLAAVAPDIWIYPMNPPGNARSLGLPDSNDFRAVWSPDGESVVFASDRTGVTQIFIQAADGTGEAELFLDTWNGTPGSFTEDGSILLYGDAGEETGWDVWMYDLSSRERKVLVDGPEQDMGGKISRDGRYFAYVALGTVHVRSIPDAAYVASWPGNRPQWGPDGRSLHFVQGGWVSAPVKEGTDIEFGELVPIARPPLGVIADGRTLTVHSRSPLLPRTRIRVILNFNQELIRRVPDD